MVREPRSLVKVPVTTDRQSAEELVDRTYRLIYAALFKLTGGDAELAADLTQETYRKAWAGLAKFEGKAQLSTWLYRIAYTTFLNHIRRPRLFVRMDDLAASALPTDPAPREDERLGRAEVEEHLRKAVLGLPDNLRFAVTARFWQGLPVTEIATLEEVSTVAVRKRLRRALRLLSLALTEKRT